jgi:hypothetical protein
MFGNMQPMGSCDWVSVPLSKGGRVEFGVRGTANKRGRSISCVCVCVGGGGSGEESGEQDTGLVVGLFVGLVELHVQGALWVEC